MWVPKAEVAAGGAKLRPGMKKRECVFSKTSRRFSNGCSNRGHGVDVCAMPLKVSSSRDEDREDRITRSGEARLSRNHRHGLVPVRYAADFYHIS